jgi:catechol 2,3-dioxygenase-like lactoylglutathione lyase family enzyme
MKAGRPAHPGLEFEFKLAFERSRTVTFKKLTPILYVESIEPCLPFWTERLGFEVTAEVPEGDALGFVMLQKDGVEVMYQTRTSVTNDVPALADTPLAGAFLFIEVDDIDGVEAAMEGVDVAVPRRTTFYGADELFVREPGGNIVGFAEMAEGGE